MCLWFFSVLESFVGSLRSVVSFCMIFCVVWYFFGFFLVVLCWK